MMFSVRLFTPVLIFATFAAAVPADAQLASSADSTRIVGEVSIDVEYPVLYPIIVGGPARADWAILRRNYNISSALRRSVVGYSDSQTRGQFHDAFGGGRSVLARVQLDEYEQVSAEHHHADRGRRD
ncbi:hypothetical protein [Sphingomonas sp. GB1N7]|uniref:hypothetical protein n=1 Tax=Parasphingomonas caseinilytica TaxID=3096158 RepID=UPI002FC7CF6E